MERRNPISRQLPAPLHIRPWEVRQNGGLGISKHHHFMVAFQRRLPEVVSGANPLLAKGTIIAPYTPDQPQSLGDRWRIIEKSLILGSRTFHSHRVVYSWIYGGESGQVILLSAVSTPRLPSFLLCSAALWRGDGRRRRCWRAGWMPLLREKWSLGSELPTNDDHIVSA